MSYPLPKQPLGRLIKKADEQLSVSPRLRRIYMLAGAAILGVTTLWWSLLGAQVQQGNADQLVDGFLFENSKTFHGAYFPGSHSLLIKWPLFYLLKLWHYTPLAYIGLTVAVCLLTVGTLAFLLYRLERRPLVFGSLCLLLAAVLYTIPAQVFAGSTSPFGMAMLTNRNIEYVVYLASLVLLLHSNHFKRWRFGGATLLLAVLIASDKLFVGLSIGGALIGLLLFTGIAYAQHKRSYQDYARYYYLRVMLRWMGASILAFFGAAILLWLVNRFATHIVDNNTDIYGTIHTIRMAIRGLWYAIASLATNFGAGTLVGLMVFVAACGAAYMTVKSVALNDQNQDQNQGSKAQILAVMLITTTAAALLMFAGSQQPHELDARYLTIGMVSSFVVLASYIRSKQLRPSFVVVAGILSVVCILCSIPGVLHTTTASKHANPTDRNQAVARALKAHPVDVLIGNYWRVIPIKALDSTQRVAPLISCILGRNTLTSQAWQPKLPNDTFAYLLSTHPTPGFPACTELQVVRRFGKPLSTQLIADTTQRPEEILLFYNLDQRAPQRNTMPLPGLR